MKKLSLLLLFFSTFFISCDNNFEEINTSPNSAEETDPNLLLAGAIINTQNNLYNMFIGGDMGTVHPSDIASIEVLKARLECRSTESEETLKVRLAKAEEEISHAPQFDQILINDDLATTIGNAKSIVTSFIQ